MSHTDIPGAAKMLDGDWFTHRLIGPLIGHRAAGHRPNHRRATDHPGMGGVGMIDGRPTDLVVAQPIIFDGASRNGPDVAGIPAPIPNPFSGSVIDLLESAFPVDDVSEASVAGTGSKWPAPLLRLAGDDCVGVRSGTASTPIGTDEIAAYLHPLAGLPVRATGAGGAPGPPGPLVTSSTTPPAPIFSSLWLSFFERLSMSVMVVLPLVAGPRVDVGRLRLVPLPTLLVGSGDATVVATGALMSPPAATAPSSIAQNDRVMLSP